MFSLTSAIDDKWSEQMGGPHSSVARVSPSDLRTDMDVESTSSRSTSASPSPPPPHTDAAKCSTVGTSPPSPPGGKDKPIFSFRQVCVCAYGELFLCAKEMFVKTSIVD